MKYFIIHPSGGDVWKTDDTELAEALSMKEEYWVVDAQEELWLLMNTVGEITPIPYVPKYLQQEREEDGYYSGCLDGY